MIVTKQIVLETIFSTSTSKNKIQEKTFLSNEEHPGCAKPHNKTCLWGSPIEGTNWCHRNWQQWCQREMPDWYNNTQTIRFKVKENAKIRVINQWRELAQFCYLTADWRGKRIHCNVEKLFQNKNVVIINYDGIRESKAEFSEEDMGLLRQALSSYDVTTVMVRDTSVIEEL